MNLSYQLTNADFLEYQLYSSSRSELHNKKRFRTKIVVALVYVVLGFLLMYQNNKPIAGGIFIVFGILWLFLYPIYSKWSYHRHFKKHVNENYKNRINKEIEIDFLEDSLNIKDFISESKINGTELKELIEIKGHFFIKMTSGLSLIIPKRVIENQIEIKTHITRLGANYVDELNWEWK